MTRNRFIDTMRVLRANHEMEARIVNVTACTVTVRHQGDETVFSRGTGRVLRGDHSLCMHPEEAAWYSPQNRAALGSGVGHLR